MTSSRLVMIETRMRKNLISGEEVCELVVARENNLTHTVVVPVSMGIAAELMSLRDNVVPEITRPPVLPIATPQDTTKTEKLPVRVKDVEEVTDYSALDENDW